MKRTELKRSTKPMRRTRFERTRPGVLATDTTPKFERVDPTRREGRQLDPADPGDGTYKPRHVTELFRYGKPQVAALFKPMPKDNPIQHEGYMALVRKLPCELCGIHGYSQFCHADIIGAGGKGKGIRSDCRLGWPGCGPHFDGKFRMQPGCHWRVGTSGHLTKEQRHEFEKDAGARTRALIEQSGMWPVDLPRWDK